MFSRSPAWQYAVPSRNNTLEQAGYSPGFGIDFGEGPIGMW